MQAIKIAVGTRFGRLIVLKDLGSIRGNSSYGVRCDCGTEKVVMGTSLRNGRTSSCGCFHREQLRKACTKHGMTRGGPQQWHPLYRTWISMKTRCYNTGTLKFKTYGARGIRVCDRWREDFVTFLRDVGERPSPRHTLERLNNEGNYDPKNVVWALPKQQGRNKRNNVRLTYRGQTLCLSEWAELLGVGVGTLSARIRAGWSVERALTTIPQRAPRSLSGHRYPRVR